MQLPDRSRARAVRRFLNTFLRGNRDTNLRSGDVSTIQALTLMNDNTILTALRSATARRSSRARSGRRRSPTRSPTPSGSRRSRAPHGRREGDRRDLPQDRHAALLATKTENLQWALFNKLEFAFY